MPHPPTDSRQSSHGLSEDLEKLLAHADGKSMTLGEMIEVLGERGHAVMIVILTAPFLVLPIPGISTAFGAAIFALGACVMLGIKPRLPGVIARREISHEKLVRLIHGVERVLLRLEIVIKPRQEWLTHKFWHWMIGVSLCAAAVALALPIPIPWNNVPPAVVLMFLALGLLERDGVMLIIGHVLNAVLWVLLLVFGGFIWEMIRRLFE